MTRNSWLETHLRERNVELDRYKSISWSTESEPPSVLYPLDNLGVATVSFRLYTVSGLPIGAMQYRPFADKNGNNDEYGRYHTHITRGNIGIWGVESLHYRDDVCFVTEGIFDAVRIHNLNLPCLAVFTNDPKPVRSQLWLLRRKIVVVCDNDFAGLRLAKYGDSVIIPPRTGLDLGDMTDSEVKSMFWEWI